MTGSERIALLTAELLRIMEPAMSEVDERLHAGMLANSLGQGLVHAAAAYIERGQLDVAQDLILCGRDALSRLLDASLSHDENVAALNRLLGGKTT